MCPFAKIWLDRLHNEDFETRARAHRSMSNSLAALNLTTACVEKKHLLGQSCKPGKRRGRALSIQALAKRTYEKQCARSRARLHDAVGRAVLGAKGMRQRFGQYLNAFRLGGNRKRRRDGTVKNDAAAVSSLSVEKTRKTRALDVFISKKFAEMDGSFAEKRQKVNVAWRNLSPEEKAHYEGLATYYSACTPLPGGAFSEKVASGGEGSSKASSRRRKRQAVSQALDDMEKHPCWKAGLQLFAYGYGMNPTKVESVSDVTVKGLIARAFAFDDKVIGLNDKTPSQPVMTCGQAHGGLCQHDVYTPPTDIALKNLYAFLSKNNLKIKTEPLLMQFKVGRFCSVQLLGRMLGKGDAAYVMATRRLDDAAERPAVAGDVLALEFVDGLPRIETLQAVAKQLLRRAEVRPGPGARLPKMEVACFKYKDGSYHSFQFRNLKPLGSRMGRDGWAVFC